MTTKSNVFRMLRGGSWDDNAEGCRPTVRVNSGPSSRSNGIGFRVVRDVSVKPDVSRLLRGGSWRSNAESCCSAYRSSNEPSGRDCHVGFRVARDVSVKPDTSRVLRGGLRVLRGGSWGSNAEYCCSAVRDFYGPSYHGSLIGFRVVRAVSGKKDEK